MEPPLQAEATGRKRLRRGAWRYTLQPGLVELDLEVRLRRIKGVEVVLWPALDSYDLRVKAGDSLWAVDVKDWSSTKFLANHLARQDRTKRLHIVVPEWRSDQIGILRQRCRGLNLQFSTDKQFLK